MGASQFLVRQGGPTEAVPKELLKRPVEFRRLADNELAAFFVPNEATATTAVPYYSTRTGFQPGGLTLNALHIVSQPATSLEAEYVLRSMYAFKQLHGQVPGPADVNDPHLADLVLAQDGVRVYRTWQNRRGKVYSPWGYAVEADHDQGDWEDDSRVFSLEENIDFSGYVGEKPISIENQLRYAIDSGQLTRQGRVTRP
jgi:hypothetical protein